MLGVLICVYRAWPLRPHCSAGHHVWLCHLLGLDKNYGRRSRCPAKDN